MTAKAAGRGLRLFGAAVFALAFGAGGLLGGIVPLSISLWRAVEVSTWQPVSAQVLEARVDELRSSDGDSTYSVIARYAYRVGGRDFEGRQVGLLDWGYDNLGDWHHLWFERLDDARKREQPVVAWVDPARPERALLDRRPRAGMVAFQLGFGTVFTGVGVGAAVMFWRSLRGASGRTSSPGVGDGLAPKVRGRLDRGSGEVIFVRQWPRALAGALVLPLLVVLSSGLWRGGWLELLLPAAGATLVLALAVHLATLRWKWRRQGDGIVVERGSWLGTRRWPLAAGEVKAIEQALVYSSRTSGQPTVLHHRLVARCRDGRLVHLTPALATPAAQRAVEMHLRQALRLGGPASR